MEFLLRYGCTEYQGFLFSPAVPADDFAEMLKNGIASVKTHAVSMMRAEQ